MIQSQISIKKFPGMLIKMTVFFVSNYDKDIEDFSKKKILKANLNPNSKFCLQDYL
jgi:hypothetical protein